MAPRISALLLGSTLLVFGFAARDLHAQGDEARQGAQRFIEYCAGCHGADAQGGDKAPPLLSTSSIPRLSDAELFRIVHDGTNGGMPPFAQIGDANIRAILQFLKNLAGYTSAKSVSTDVAVPGDPDSGRALYFGKARCSQCHLMQGKGGFIAGNLTNYARNRTADDIVKAITTPDTPLAPASQVVILTTGSGQKLTGVLRNEDNFSLELQTEDGRFHFLDRSAVTDVHYTERSLMPRDYAAKLSPKELADLVSFLLVSGRTPQPEKPAAR